MANSAADIIANAAAQTSAAKATANATTGVKQMSEAANQSKSPIDGLRSAMGMARSGMGSFGKALSSIVNVGKLATAGLGPIGALITGITSGLMAPIDAIKELANTVINFVQLANPGAVQQFTLAMNDAIAVMGGMLTPVLQGMTFYVRTFGDVLAKIGPIIQPLFDVLARHIVAAAVAGSQLLEAFAPLMEFVVDAMVPAIAEMTSAMAFLQGILIEVVRTVMDLFGLKSKRINPDGSAQGAAVRKFSSQNVEGFSRSLFEKQLAMLSKGGQGKDPIQHIPDIAAAIKEGQKVVSEIKDFVKEIAEWFKRRKQDIDDVQTASNSGQAGMLGALAGPLGRIFIK